MALKEATATQLSTHLWNRTEVRTTFNLTQNYKRYLVPVRVEGTDVNLPDVEVRFRLAPDNVHSFVRGCVDTAAVYNVILHIPQVFPHLHHLLRRNLYHQTVLHDTALGRQPTRCLQGAVEDDETGTGNCAETWHTLVVWGAKSITLVRSPFLGLSCMLIACVVYVFSLLSCVSWMHTRCESALELKLPVNAKMWSLELLRVLTT